ncbi:MAG: glycoside hydrolase family 3 C-terminal domain-containing protein [Bacteroidales bacterium]
MKNKSFLSIIVMGLALLTACSSGPVKLGKAPVRKVVESMTLEQKAELVVGTGMFFEIPDSLLAMMPGGVNPFAPKKDELNDSAYWAMVEKIRDLVPGAAGRTAEFEGLGIPTNVLCDGPAGLRISPTRKGDNNTYYCTAFPIATLLASSWDTALVRSVGEAMGNEVLEYGADVILGPGMNLQRNPLCGRNFEYYSEDPLITGKMAASMVKGIQSQGVGTSIKHFAANNQETNRNTVNTIVSERALRELYLEGFRIAVQEGQPWTVMSSYNKINGSYTSESHDLLTKILRNDWGFKGYVMTDWGGGKDPIAQMKAGNDLLMPGSGKQISEIIQAVKEGKLEEKVLDKNVENILNIILKSPKFRGYSYSNKPDLKAHAEVTRKAAAEGMVLLKNSNSALPFSNIKKVAIFGVGSFNLISGGTGSGDVNEAYTVSLVQGLENAGLTIEEKSMKEQLDHIQKAKANQPQRRRFFFMPPPVIPEFQVKPALASASAQNADAALITISRNSGEGADRKAEKGDFYLSDEEMNLIKTVSSAFHAAGKKVVVVLNIGGVIETASWRDIPDAVLLAWQPGQEAGNSIADVLLGKVNPSGKLACTFPMKYDDVPSAKNFPGIELPDTSTRKPGSPLEEAFLRAKPAEVVYEEDIFVGYRYFNTFKVPVAYEFGYGLSYSTFDVSNLVPPSGKFAGKYEFSVDVKNTGSTAGREVVQVYLAAPAGKLVKPAEKLVAFAKTSLLQPGETQTLRFVLVPRDLASFDDATSTWIAEKGNYEVRVGVSSLDIRQKATFELPNDLTVEKDTKALVPDREIKVLRP